MRGFKRSAVPSYLHNSKELGEAYQQKRANRKKGEKDSFSWFELYDDLLKDISPLTQCHCSYCDLSKIKRGRVSPTIDHFRPKADFPLLAYTWSNLFLCCTECQKRKNKFDELLLKPDDDTYSFDDFFIINTISGFIEPHPKKDDDAKNRAEKTIKIFKLNDNDRPQYRLDEWNSFQNSSNQFLDDYSYRFFIERMIL